MKVGSHQMDYAAIARERQTMTQQPPDREAIARMIQKEIIDWILSSDFCQVLPDTQPISIIIADTMLSSFPVGVGQTRIAEGGQCNEQQPQQPSPLPGNPPVELPTDACSVTEGGARLFILESAFNKLVAELNRPRATPQTRPSESGEMLNIPTIENALSILERLLRIIDSGHYRDKAHLSIAAHPAVDDARALLKSVYGKAVAETDDVAPDDTRLVSGVSSDPISSSPSMRGSEKT